MSTRGIIGCAVAVWALALGLSARAPLAAASSAFPDTPPAAVGVQPPENTDCLMCHEDEGLARADGRSVAVDPAMLEASIHGAFPCVTCHIDLAETTDWPHAEKLAPADCSTCHADAVEAFREGVHAAPRPDGTAAASCADCHGAHDIRPSKDPQSRTNHFAIAGTCARCHGDTQRMAAFGMTEVATAFADSIHGRALARAGLVVAPTCSDCHGAHDTRAARDPASRVSPGQVAATCGSCHEGITRQFAGGVHAAVLGGGHDGAPACHTCHTAHAIPRAESTAWQLSVIGQCGTCHADRVATFRDTFHGQVTNLGFRAVAGCADCHGAHEVLPASDPRSPIAPGNLVETCGKCHPNANENFVKYDPHADRNDRARSPLLYYASRFMGVLLIGVFGFFGLHSTLWFAGELRARRERRALAAASTKAAGRPPAATPGPRDGRSVVRPGDAPPPTGPDDGAGGRP